MSGYLSHAATGDPAGNPGLCPDWESNWWPFLSQADAQSTEPHQTGCKCIFLIMSQYHRGKSRQNNNSNYYTPLTATSFLNIPLLMYILYHIILPFQVYNSMIFSKFFKLCGDYHKSILEHFHHPNKVSFIVNPCSHHEAHGSTFFLHRFAFSGHFI